MTSERHSQGSNPGRSPLGGRLDASLSRAGTTA
jgi:hypothetical protein